MARENWPLCQSLAQLGRPGALLHALSPTVGKERFLLALSCGDSRCVKSKCPLTLSSASKLELFFATIVCWNFSGAYFNFHKCSVICGWLSKATLQGHLDYGRDGLEAVMGHCRGRSQGMFACYLVHTWVRLLQGPLACGAGLHSTHKGIFVRGCMSDCCGGGDDVSDAFFSHLAHKMTFGWSERNCLKLFKASVIFIYSTSIHSSI